MKSIKQQKHLERLNSIPRTKEWKKHISEAKLGKKGSFIQCFNCHKEFYRRQSTIKKERNYCSNNCRIEFRKGKPLNEEHKKKLGIKSKEFWSSKKGEKAKENRRKKIYGNGNGNWRGGSLGFWRRIVFERDKRVCQLCGLDEKMKGFMEVDHIKPKSEFPELKNNIDNMMTLCPNCHKRKSLKERYVK